MKDTCNRFNSLYSSRGPIFLQVHGGVELVICNKTFSPVSFFVHTRLDTHKTVGFYFFVSRNK